MLLYIQSMPRPNGTLNHSTCICGLASQGHILVSADGEAFTMLIISFSFGL